ncbi:MAG: TatD family hydrolase [Thermoleophilia bacterium]|nr:TatD family hydrolase [Thermoleophilia bacterium]
MIDTHAHLDACDEPADELLARARAAGVTRVIAIGTGIESCRRALMLAERDGGVYAAVGIDPHRAATGEAGRVEELTELARHPKAVAVGETGLDYHHGAGLEAAQRRLFERQLAVAEEVGKPVVIHCRAAADETAAMLAGFAGTVVLHCFSEPGLFPAAAERGYYVSFAGNVTYPRSADLRELATRVPAARILAETDAPYLSPQPLRGRRNEPANVVHTLSALAAARGEDAAELERRIDANARTAFGLA